MAEQAETILGKPVRHCAALALGIAQWSDAGADTRVDELRENLPDAVREHHGTVIQADGDTLLAVFCRAREAAADAAGAALSAQQTAFDAGLGLYAGLHYGPVEFLQAHGRSQTHGLAVKCAAWLCQLTPGVPGSILLTRETAALLPPRLHGRTRVHGRHVLQDIGEMEVHTLEWKEFLTLPMAHAGTAARRGGALELRHGERRLRLGADAPPLMIGRSAADCALVVEDNGESPLVSRQHVLILQRGGRWICKDLSRNGTWLHDGASGDEQLLVSVEATLPRQGWLCLGRDSSHDPERRFTVEFAAADADHGARS